MFTCSPAPGKMCPNQAEWLVWFEECGGLYTYKCSQHAIEALRNGVNGYKVVCLRSIDDAIYKKSQSAQQQNAVDRLRADAASDEVASASGN